MLGDMSIHFRIWKEGRVEYTVVDPFTRAEETVLGSWEYFVDALNMALRVDGEPSKEPVETQWANANAVMPEDPTLRWIP